MVLYLPGRLDNRQKRFLAAIPDIIEISSGQTTKIATRVLHASDSDDEVRCVVRDVVARLQDNERVAVLYTDRTPYARLCAEQVPPRGHHHQWPRLPSRQ